MECVRTRSLITAAFALGAVSAHTLARVPFYLPSRTQLQARANFSGAFNLPNSSFFTNSTPSINETASIAFKLEVLAGSSGQGVWFGANASGAVRYTSPDDAVLSDPVLNNAAGALPLRFAVNQFFTSPTAIIRVDALTGASTIGVAPGGFFGVISFSGSILNDSGVIGFRGTQAIGGQAFISDLSGSQSRHIAEVGADPGSPYSFLFTPAMNNNRQIAAKARRGALGQTGESQPDEIRIWNADGSSLLIAQDHDANPVSSIASFDNSVSINDAGAVAFIATSTSGVRSVFRTFAGGPNDSIATTNAGAGNLRVNGVEFFRPDINRSGVVTFRGVDTNGLQAIFVGDTMTLRRVIGKGDSIATDLGPGMINQHDSSPVFGGSPSINDAGDVAFNCALTPAGDNQIEWGSGMYIIHATLPADLDGDGDVDAADLATVLGNWGPCVLFGPCPGDVNNDGWVNALDIAILLGSWG